MVVIVTEKACDAELEVTAGFKNRWSGLIFCVHFSVVIMHSKCRLLLQAFMGLPVGGGSLPLGFQNVGMIPGLPQMWATAGQPYPGSLMSATQLQELCGSGTNSSTGQLQHPVAAAASDPQQLAALLR